MSHIIEVHNFLVGCVAIEMTDGRNDMRVDMVVALLEVTSLMAQQGSDEH